MPELTFDQLNDANARRPYKALVEEVLAWMSDEEDEGLLRRLVKSAISRAHLRALLKQQYEFMLWPRVETLDIVAGQKHYILHPMYQQGLYFYNPTTDEYMEEVSQKQLLESEEDWQDGEADEPLRFSLTSLNNVSAQPAAAGVVVVTTTGGTEAATNGIIVAGMVGNDYREETLSSAIAWSTLTGSLSFDRILNITKVGEEWTRTIAVTVGATTIITLLSGQYGKQFRQLELLTNPSRAATIQYRFYQKPLSLVRDLDIPQIPEEFSEILVLDALLKMQGFSRATGDEIAMWRAQHKELMDTMTTTYSAPRTLGNRPRFVNYIPRV